MPFWPDLPPPLLGYSPELQDPVVRSEMEVGPPKARRRTDFVGPRANPIFRLTYQQSELLQDWWRYDCNAGATPFIWYEPRRGRPGLWRWQRPPKVSRQGVAYEDVTCELLCIEEWWPGALAGTGRLIYIWDAWWATSVKFNGKSSSLNGQVSTWTDRINGIVLDALSPTNTILTQSGYGRLVEARSSAVLRHQTLSTSFSAATWVIGGRRSQASGGPSGNTRLLSWKPATGYDYNQSDGAGVVITNADTQVGLTANLPSTMHSISANSPRAVLVRVGSQRWIIDIDDVQKMDSAGPAMAGNSSGGLALNAHYLGAGGFAEQGHYGFGGFTVISGYAPTRSERTMLSRWAAALAGKDLFA